jgi:hypothetical protein
MNLRRIGNGCKLLGLAVMACVLVPHLLLFIQRVSQSRTWPPPYSPEGPEPLVSWMRVLVGVGVGSVLLWVGDLLKSRSKGGPT